METSARNLEIVRRRFAGETYVRIARDYGITTTRVRAIHLKHLRMQQRVADQQARRARIITDNRNASLEAKFQVITRNLAHLRTLSTKLLAD